MKKSQKEHYVDNQKFYEEIVEYREKVKQAIKEGKKEPKLSNYIGECIYNIATRLSYSPKFINYSFRDEMIAEAIKNSIEYFNSYDPNYVDANGKKNPFTYFTQVAYYAFLHVINKEEKNRYTRYKNFEETMILSGNLLYDEDNNLIPNSTYDNISSFIEKFEQKEMRKKEKNKTKKKLKELENGKATSNITTSNTAVDGIVGV